MRVLFVSSGNSDLGISPIVKKQGESLIKQGIEVTFFTVKGKGLLGYLKNIPKLRKAIKKLQPDVIHAHYSLCGFISTLSLSGKKIIVSLMGSDVLARGISGFIIRLFYKISWNKCIVKTEGMKKQVGLKNIVVLPNGVDMQMFKPIPRDKAIKILNWNPVNKHILFAANPSRPEKNFSLAEKAFEQIKEKSESVELHVLKDVSHDQIPILMSASDCILLTSLWEGSPNVIKEAMACSRPIVSTKVGDVNELLKDTPLTFVVPYNADEIAESIFEIISSGNNKTIGREKISYLSEEKIAEKLIQEYKQIIN
jgi:glycosyltransferase involved in cell wall biosynthesis